MPLIKYFQYLTYPGGDPAADESFPVQLTGGNVLVPTFTTKAGTTALTNPVLTDNNGLLTFYAAPGDYFTDISGTLFQYLVDPTETDEAWPGTFVHVQSASSATWTVNHHLGVQPQVVVLVSGIAVEAGVSHTNDETTVITFGASTSGTAYLRR